MELTLPIDIRTPGGELVARFEQGAAEGSSFVTLRLFRGDLINVRNVQGGTVENPNLDLGAGSDGSSGPRGAVVVNWDVGDSFQVFDGRKERVFAVNRRNSRRIDSHLPHRFYHGAYVRRADGSWRKL